jgi:hypothetical protein
MSLNEIVLKLYYVYGTDLIDFGCTLKIQIYA